MSTVQLGPNKPANYWLTVRCPCLPTQQGYCPDLRISATFGQHRDFITFVECTAIPPTHIYIDSETYEVKVEEEHWPVMRALLLTLSEEWMEKEEEPVERYSSHNYYTFKGTGITGPYRLPFVNYLTPEAVRLGLYNYDTHMRKKHGKLIGMDGKKPQLIVFDEELITQVMVKQFHNFTNRTSLDLGDKVMENMVSVMKDEQWKHTRSTMSPTFTTGRLRKMAGEINRCAKILAESISSKDEPFEARNVSGRYTMDVIASTAFGLRVDSQNEENNDFHRHGKILMESVGLTSPLLLIMILAPPLGKLLNKMGITLFNKKSSQFFIDVAKQTLSSRVEGDKARHDFIQLMANARRGEETHDKTDEHEVEKLGNSTRVGLNDDEILSNAFIFFLAGFDTTATGLTMLLYNLALNPECQDKAIEEIDAIVGDKGEVDYNTVMKMTYLEQCLHESLRLHPPAGRLDRVAKEDITINGVTIKKGMSVQIPVYALHHDPDIWDEPEKFDPDRFSPEKKATRNPISWLPFGNGPRNCIAQRLALYELKVAVAHILKNYRLVKCDKTEIPLTYQTGKWLRAKNGVWLAIEKRN